MNDNTFQKAVLAAQAGPLRAFEITTLQANLGCRCNLACTHCHVNGGPARTETMDKATMDAMVRILAGHAIATLDITGGAPELNPHFRSLVSETRRLGRRVIVRSNLAVIYEAGMEDLPEFYQDHDVELVASLPCYTEETVDRVRGTGTFLKSIRALEKLNSLGYGTGSRVLNLVYNPQGAFLAPAQETLEQGYKRELQTRFSVSFDRLYTFANMPIGRFGDLLRRDNTLDSYMNTLACAFNAAALDQVMCRRMISVGWDGRVYDCDFNVALGLPVTTADGPVHVAAFDHGALKGREIRTGDHCFGCTAGQGST